MQLTMRPTGLESAIDKDRQDFTIFSGDWAMGRIYEDRGAPRKFALVLVAARDRQQAAGHAHRRPRTDARSRKDQSLPDLAR